MKLKSYLVESINFDFEDSQGTIPEQDQKDIIDDTLGIWFAYDEDHLLDKISETMGWCITDIEYGDNRPCLLYTSPSPRDLSTSRMPSSA